MQIFPITKTALALKPDQSSATISMEFNATQPLVKDLTVEREQLIC